MALALATACGYDAQDSLDAAQLELTRGDLEQALELLRDGLAENPDHLELNLLYAQVLLQTGRPSLAVWSLAKVAADPAHAMQAGLLLARAQIASGSFDDAIVSLDRVLAKEPENEAALRLRAAAKLRVSRESDALEDIERGLALVPDDLGLMMAKLTALLRLERGDEAADVMAALRRGIDAVEGMPPAQRAQLAGRYCIAEASFTYENGDTEGAEAAYLACLDAYPNQPLVISATTGFLDRIGKHEQATQTLRDALAAEPNNLPRRVTLSDRLRESDPEEAEQLLREMVDEQPEVWAALADHYLALEDRAAAVDALEHALALHPGLAPPEWSLMRADLLIQLGDYEAAEPAISALEEPVYRHVTRGRLELARGKPARALELLSEGIRLWPDGATARYLAAQAAEQLGDFARAESEYKEALRAGEAHTDAGLQLAQLLYSRDRGQEALSVITTYSSQAPDDATAYETAFEIAERHASPRLAQSILARYRSRPAHTVRSLAFALGVVARTQGAEAAVRAVEQSSLDLRDPAFAPVLAVVTESLSEQGSYPAALARIDAALSAHPGRTELLVLRGSVLEAAGSVDEARNTYLRALDSAASNPDALMRLAGIAARAGEIDAAVALYDRAAESAPDDPEPVYAAARLLREQRSPEAVPRMQSVLVRDPRHAGAATALVDDLIDRDQANSDQALALARRALRFSRSSETLASYVRLHIARGEPGEAIRALHRAGGEEPNSPSTQFLLGRALILAGRPESGAELLHDALAQSDFPEREEAERTLAELAADANPPASSESEAQAK
jgi:tetratricopeptide (TPR) repeat protein